MAALNDPLETVVAATNYPILPLFILQGWLWQPQIIPYGSQP